MQATTNCVTKYHDYQSLQHHRGIAIPYPHYMAHKCASDGCECILLHIFSMYAHLLIHIHQVYLQAIFHSSYILTDDLLIWERSNILSFHCHVLTIFCLFYGYITVALLVSLI